MIFRIITKEALNLQLIILLGEYSKISIYSILSRQMVT